MLGGIIKELYLGLPSVAFFLLCREIPGSSSDVFQSTVQAEADSHGEKGEGGALLGNPVIGVLLTLLLSAPTFPLN